MMDLRVLADADSLNFAGQKDVPDLKVGDVWTTWTRPEYIQIVSVGGSRPCPGGEMVKFGVEIADMELETYTTAVMELFSLAFVDIIEPMYYDADE